VYKEISILEDFKKPNFSKMEVLAYLTGLRKNGKNTNANRDIHDKLYNLIKDNLNNQTQFYDLSFTEQDDSTKKTGLDLLKILVISNSSKYDKSQTELQNTINKMFNDKTQLIPDEYRNALKQLLDCVKSKKDFNYAETDSDSPLIFTFNSLLENDFEILNYIIKNLNKTHFKMDSDQNWVRENTFRPVYCDANECEHSGKYSRRGRVLGSLSTPYKDLFGTTVLQFLKQIILKKPTEKTLT
jgi:hypothetical protein